MQEPHLMLKWLQLLPNPCPTTIALKACESHPRARASTMDEAISSFQFHNFVKGERGLDFDFTFRRVHIKGKTVPFHDNIPIRTVCFCEVPQNKLWLIKFLNTCCSRSWLSNLITLTSTETLLFIRLVWAGSSIMEIFFVSFGPFGLEIVFHCLSWKWE